MEQRAAIVHLSVEDAERVISNGTKGELEAFVNECGVAVRALRVCQVEAGKRIEELEAAERAAELAARPEDFPAEQVIGSKQGVNDGK